jgi:hypothetical protein
MDDPKFDNLVISFRGSCQGVGLKQRGPNDPHVCYVILTEDDEYWFVSSEQSASAFWMPELMDCFEQATEWLRHNAVKDEHGCYRFQSDKEREVKRKKNKTWEKRYNEVQQSWEAWEDKEARAGRGYKGIPSVDAKPLNRAIEGKCVIFHTNDDGMVYTSPILANPTYARVFKCFSDSIAIDEHHCFMEGVVESKDRNRWPAAVKAKFKKDVKVYRFATGS